MSATVEAGIQATERYLGVELPYMREIARVRPALLERLSAFTEMAGVEGETPPDVVHLAGLGATLAQDCGPCVQIGVNLALRAGVDPAVLRGALGRSDGARLTDAQADALAFGRAVAEGLPAADDLREKLRARYGDAAIVELAWTISGAQFYPILKRGMGFATSCSLVRVEVPA